MEPILRLEQPGDEACIHSLTELAFKPTSLSDGTEALIIDNLRREGDLTLSIVATLAGEVVGHVAFSPVTINGERGQWFGLGPVSVRPDLQGKGIGAALINEGMSILRSERASGCALIGDPRYYRRLGFRSNGKLTYKSLPTSVVQVLPFKDEVPEGVLAFSPAFERL